MKTDSDDIDRLIKQTLTEEEARFYDELDEQGLLQMFGGLFKGKLSWLIVLLNVVQVAAFIGAIYCGVQFFQTDITNELIMWGLAGWFCLMVVTLMKLFTWMQMDKQAILRELKRVELQISILASKAGQNTTNI